MRQSYGQNSFLSSHFEFPPISSNDYKILFLARLWNPDEVESEHLKHERNELNQERIKLIRYCKQVFGNQFLGGLKKDDFTKKTAPDLVVPYSLNNKKSYLQTVKEHDICVATTGLHDSIGWKFGEYIAASRAVISEPLKYQIPGNFEEGKNYLSFTNGEELIEKATSLIDSPDLMRSMMKNNYHYYNNYLAPDKLVLNTLLKIYKQIT